MSGILDRVFNRIYTVVITPLKEKTFRAEGTRLKYLFFPGRNNCDTLIVGFQACHKDGARYNYVRTLKEIPVHKLFIKDDFAENHRGNYYLGSNGQYNVEKATYELIDKFIKQYNPQNIIFIGSSKGGYAAVNFGVSYENANIVIAAPQYHLGDYLNCEYQMPNLKDILGDFFTENSVKYLNARLQKKIEQDKFGKSQKVFIHYSRNDHTYDEHIKDLLTDLASAGISIDEDIKDYTVHGELKFYYPDYLRKSVRGIIQGSKFDE